MSAGGTVDYQVWREERRRLLARQLELLTRPAKDRPGLSNSRTHRPRSEDHWAAIADGARAELERRETNGRWAWVERRRLLISSR